MAPTNKRFTPLEIAYLVSVTGVVAVQLAMGL